MRQIVKVARPPVFDECRAKFGMRVDRAIFSWGDIIYNPAGIQIPPALLAHEKVHGERQGRNVEDWWRRYLDDPEFRLAEEVPAHAAEYRCLAAGNRQMRRARLNIVASRLAGPLYGKMLTLAQAKEMIRKAG